MPNKQTKIAIAVVGFMLFAVLAGLTVVAFALASQIPAAPTPPQAQAVDSYPAEIYFSDLYQAEGALPLHTWQPISVYGESFPACVVEHVGGRTTLTVNPDDSRICPDR